MCCPPAYVAESFCQLLKPEHIKRKIYATQSEA